MTVHNYRSRQVHETLNGVNPSNGFRDMRSAKSGPNLCQIWQVFGPWASPYGANGQMTMTVHNYRPRQFHRTSNGENPSRGYRDMGSASLAAARPAARTVTTIPLQPGGLRGKNELRNVKMVKVINTLRPRQKGCHFVNNIFNSIFLNENCFTFNQNSLIFFPNGSINNKSALIQILLRYWVVTEHKVKIQARCHYLNQWWPSWLSNMSRPLLILGPVMQIYNEMHH